MPRPIAPPLSSWDALAAPFGGSWRSLPSSPSPASVRRSWCSGAIARPAIALVPPVMVVMNVIYARAAYPASILSDRVDRVCPVRRARPYGRRRYFPRPLPPIARRHRGGPLGPPHGLHPGPFRALVADTAPPELRGTAFGMFNLLTGVPFSPRASSPAAAGRPGPEGTFLCGRCLHRPRHCPACSSHARPCSCGQEAN